MKSILEIHQQLVNKECSAVEITQTALKQIQTLEPKVQSFLHITSDEALKQAQKIDDKIAAGEEIGLMAGIPISIKDAICTKNIPTTCGSKILENFIPPYNATVINKLLEAGAVILGKTNCDEFAMGSSTENSAYKITHNPWNLDCVPGGSSGGSASAVATGEGIVSLGSDTGGSIRQPASFCGIVGLKPTYGLVSRFGLIAYGSSLDQIGPMGRSVEDTAIVLETIAGYDAQDSTSLNVNIPEYSKDLGSTSLKGMKVGLIKEYCGEGINSEVEDAVNKAIAQLKSLGAQVKTISCPHFSYGIPAYYIIATSEASANLARYDGVKYGLRTEDIENLQAMYKNTRSNGFGKEVKRRIMLGTYTLSAGYYDAYYLKAQKVRTLIKQDFDKAFEEVDVLLSPTAPTTAFKIGENVVDPMSMYLGDIMTVNINLAGVPALSLPCGFDSQGLPIGLQIIGNVLQESTILKVAHTYEQSTNWHQQVPSISNNVK